MEAIAGDFKHSSLLERLEDLENRSRWANLWILKIPEGSQDGWDPIEFISELLRDGMGTDVFSKPLKLERAQRTLGPKPGHGGSTTPRAFVIRFHRIPEKERGLHWARQNEQKYGGAVLRIYPDLSTTLAKKRASFNSIKQALYQKWITVRLLYPAQLRVTRENETHTFETPEDANSWLIPK